jgi:hypothetical protein
MLMNWLLSSYKSFKIKTLPLESQLLSALVNSQRMLFQTFWTNTLKSCHAWSKSHNNWLSQSNKMLSKRLSLLSTNSLKLLTHATSNYTWKILSQFSLTLLKAHNSTETPSFGLSKPWDQWLDLVRKRLSHFWNQSLNCCLMSFSLRALKLRIKLSGDKPWCAQDNLLQLLEKRISQCKY